MLQLALSVTLGYALESSCCVSRTWNLISIQQCFVLLLSSNYASKRRLFSNYYSLASESFDKNSIIILCCPFLFTHSLTVFRIFDKYFFADSPPSNNKKSSLLMNFWWRLNWIRDNWSIGAFYLYTNISFPSSCRPRLVLPQLRHIYNEWSQTNIDFENYVNLN